MNKKKLKKIFKESLEDWPKLPKKTRNQYRKMRCDFDKYMGGIEEQAFIYGFQCAVKMLGWCS